MVFDVFCFFLQLFHLYNERSGCCPVTTRNWRLSLLSSSVSRDILFPAPTDVTRARRGGERFPWGFSRRPLFQLLTFSLNLSLAKLVVLTYLLLLLHPFNGVFFRTTCVSRYQKGKTNLGFCEARDDGFWDGSGISWTICTSLQTDNHTNTSSLNYLQAGCSSRRRTNSVKALNANVLGLLTPTTTTTMSWRAGSPSAVMVNARTLDTEAGPTLWPRDRAATFGLETRLYRTRPRLVWSGLVSIAVWGWQYQIGLVWRL